MTSLLQYLRQFNAKERFFLVGHVLGNPQFKLGSAFKAELSKALNLSIPSELFCAMDFHLDWLYAALRLHADEGKIRTHANSDRIIKAQQEDIDFLIGYESGGQHHLILIEAKGATGWTNSQMQSKAARFTDIFGNDGCRWRGVVPHFVLMSPRPPQRILISGWPQWMSHNGQLAWLRLPIADNLIQVSRCTEDGKPSALGVHWTVLNR